MSGRGILDADMTTIGGWIADGLRWWGAELRAMVPAALRPGDDPDRVIALRRGGDGTALDPAGLAGAGGKVVALPEGLCLLRQVTMPAAGDRDLERMVALDADRLMPLGRDGTIVAARAIRRGGSGSGGGTMTVTVAGLARSHAAQVGTLLCAAGSLPTAVLTGVPQDGAPEPVDLLPALRQAGLVPDERPAVARWWLVALFLLALNTGLLVWRDMAATDALEQIVAGQQPALSAARRLHARIVRDSRIVASTRAARGAREPLAILDRVGGALPAGAWLKSYAWQGDTVRMAGFRPARADVASALRAAGFAGVRNDEGPSSAATALGQPFQLTTRLGAPR